MNGFLNGLRWVSGTGLLIGALGIGLVGVTSADEEWGLFKEGDEYDRTSAKVDLSPQRLLYVEECSACHMAYPAGFLPQRSWRKMMVQLDDHFGENAELDPSSQTIITDYLVANASENSSNRRAKKFLRGIKPSDVPNRITALAYFKRKHDELNHQHVRDNKDVGSFSQCQTCHGDQAEQGIFDEDTVNIPNFGRWDD